ncbi:MAG TPA: HAD-IIA family hydrolase [Patescibacteria group bacterium]|nr:HAD-IIA family hydrolase [Patescibacteria group bacterium]
MSVPPQVQARLKRLRHVALDLDGTLYSGQTLFPATLPFLEVLAELGIGRTFLTNNSSKSTRDYVAHLLRFGIAAAEHEIYTSTQATIRFLRRNYPQVSRVFVLGTDSLCAEIGAAGFGLAKDDAADEPQAVICGFDTSLVFARLCRAAYWIKKGKLFVATHPDRVCPTDQPTLLVDCGSICAALEKASGRAPDAVLGKPDPGMLGGILERDHLAPDELAMAGDRLYTDMEMARRVGSLGVLVLTGETTAAEAERADPPVDLVVQDLAAFGQLLRCSRPKRA